MQVIFTPSGGRWSARIAETDIEYFFRGEEMIDQMYQMRLLQEAMVQGEDAVFAIAEDIFVTNSEYETGAMIVLDIFRADQLTFDGIAVYEALEGVQLIEVIEEVGEALAAFV